MAASKSDTATATRPSGEKKVRVTRAPKIVPSTAAPTRPGATKFSARHLHLCKEIQQSFALLCVQFSVPRQNRRKLFIIGIEVRHRQPQHFGNSSH